MALYRDVQRVLVWLYAFMAVFYRYCSREKRSEKWNRVNNRRMLSINFRLSNISHCLKIFVKLFVRKIFMHRWTESKTFSTYRHHNPSKSPIRKFSPDYVACFGGVFFVYILIYHILTQAPTPRMKSGWLYESKFWCK